MTKIFVRLSDDVDKGMYVPSDVFAQSAFTHNVSIDEFTRSLNEFCDRAVAAADAIYKWREEATQLYFALLEKSGKLNNKAVDFLGGSDYENSEDTNDLVYSNIKNNKENNNHGKSES